MKAWMLAFLGCLFILISGSAFAWEEDCANGSCGPAACNPYETNCQCTDPSCNAPWDTNCTSRAECCEAFGNVGGR